MTEGAEGAEGAPAAATFPEPLATAPPPPCTTAASAPPPPCTTAPPRTCAPYPAASTASIISCALKTASSNVTTMLFLSKFTGASCTPDNLLTAFSTRAEHAEHVMPKTSKVSFFMCATFCLPSSLFVYFALQRALQRICFIAIEYPLGVSCKQNLAHARL